MTLADIVRLGKSEADSAAFVKAQLHVRKSTSAGSVPGRHGKLTSVIEPLNLNGKMRKANSMSKALYRSMA